MSRSAHISALRPDKRGQQAFFKSADVQRGLQQAADGIATKASMLAEGHAYKKPIKMQPYKAHVKLLKYKAVAVVRPTTSQGKAIEAKYHTLSQFGGPRK